MGQKKSPFYGKTVSRVDLTMFELPASFSVASATRILATSKARNKIEFIRVNLNLGLALSAALL
jgi:hypothetical protein